MTKYEVLTVVLVLTSMFTYHWYNGAFYRPILVVSDEDAFLLHEVYHLTRKYVETNNRHPETLGNLLLIASPQDGANLKKCLESNKNLCQINFYPELIQQGYPAPAVIIATEPDPNDTNRLRVLFYDGRVESLEKNDVTGRLEFLSRKQDPNHHQITNREAG